MTCTCIGIKEAAERTLGGLAIPTCDEHDDLPPEAGPAIALNDDAGLLGALGQAIGIDLTTTSTLEGA